VTNIRELAAEIVDPPEPKGVPEDPPVLPLDLQPATEGTVMCTLP